MTSKTWKGHFSVRRWAWNGFNLTSIWPIGMTAWPILLQYITSGEGTTLRQPWTAPSARTAPSPWNDRGWFWRKAFCKGHDLETVYTPCEIDTIHHDTQKMEVLKMIFLFEEWFSGSMLLFGWSTIGMSGNWASWKISHFQILFWSPILAHIFICQTSIQGHGRICFATLQLPHYLSRGFG